MNVKKEYISFDEVKGYCLDIAVQMIEDNWKPELIIGITRGGALPAVLLSQFFKCKMIGLDVCLRDNADFDMGPESNCWAAELAMDSKKILIVDDINDTGATINWIINDWDYDKSYNAMWGDNVRFSTIVQNESSKAMVTPQYYGYEVNKAENDVWIEFPWENWWRVDQKV
jgi:hypoxanthine phosphoribosyltransferase